MADGDNSGAPATGMSVTVASRNSAVYSCCMSATRTQVYLTEEQRTRIDRTAESEGVTMAEVIRRAIDQYLGDEADPAVALDGDLRCRP